LFLLKARAFGERDGLVAGDVSHLTVTPRSRPRFLALELDGRTGPGEKSWRTMSPC